MLSLPADTYIIVLITPYIHILIYLSTCWFLLLNSYMAEKSCHYSSPLPNNSMHVIKVCAKIKWITSHVFHCKILRTWECDFIPNAVNTHQPVPQIDCYCDNKIFISSTNLVFSHSYLKSFNDQGIALKALHHLIIACPSSLISSSISKHPLKNLYVLSRLAQSTCSLLVTKLLHNFVLNVPFLKHTSSTSLISKLYLPWNSSSPRQKKEKSSSWIL